MLTAEVKIIIKKSEADNTPAFGRGVCQLCALIDELGSLNRAAQEMGMAYSKAWRIMKNTEEVFGVDLIERRGPKGSVLTEEGKKLVAVYRAVRTRINDAADMILAEELERHGMTVRSAAQS